MTPIGYALLAACGVAALLLATGAILRLFCGADGTRWVQASTAISLTVILTAAVLTLANVAILAGT